MYRAAISLKKDAAQKIVDGFQAMETKPQALPKRRF